MRLIDADALKREQMKAFNCESATKYGNKDAKQQERSYSTIMLYEVSDIIEDTIDNAPTVPLPDFKAGYRQAVLDGKTNFSRPQGKWIKKVDDVGFISYICSNCGFELELEDCSDSHYCTICGADMEVIKND